MRRIHTIAVFALILMALIFAYSQTPQQTTRTAQTETRAQKNEAVKAKKILVKELPKGLKGLVLKDGVFRLSPGYKFVGKTTNRFAALDANGHGGSFQCSCFSANGIIPRDPISGSCIAEFKEGAISCRPDPWDRCNRGCTLFVDIDERNVGLAIF